MIELEKGIFYFGIRKLCFDDFCNIKAARKQFLFQTIKQAITKTILVIFQNKPSFQIALNSTIEVIYLTYLLSSKIQKLKIKDIIARVS